MRRLRWGISIDAKIGKEKYELSYETGISKSGEGVEGVNGDALGWTSVQV